MLVKKSSIKPLRVAATDLKPPHRQKIAPSVIGLPIHLWMALGQALIDAGYLITGRGQFEQDDMLELVLEHDQAPLKVAGHTFRRGRYFLATENLEDLMF